MNLKHLLNTVTFCLIIFFSIGCVSDITLVTKTIKGNGVLLTKEIAIEDYDKIEIASKVELNYQQLDEEPYLQFTMDENLMDYLNIYVKNKTLYIEPAKNETGMSTYNLNPTQFVVNTNSKQVKNINLAGSGTVNLISDIRTDKLNFEIVGSGSVVSKKLITANNLDINLSGSGEIHLNERVEKSKIAIVGSGKAFLEGTVETCKVIISGSGSVISPNLSVKHFNSDIVGSGKIKINVIESLNCNISGSGTITYTGNPSSVRQNIAGSGKMIKK